ncbi:hypothetical protein ABIF25_000796 [Bradyrhizobium elkanii]
MPHSGLERTRDARQLPGPHLRRCRRAGAVEPGNGRCACARQGRRRGRLARPQGREPPLGGRRTEPHPRGRKDHRFRQDSARPHGPAGGRGNDPRGEACARSAQSRRILACPRDRSPAPGANCHGRWRRAERCRVWRVFLQSHQRCRRELHALHAFGSSAGGVLEIPDAAKHRSIRADVQRRGHRALRRHHQGCPLRQEPAA